jgi:hypothetical protein
MFRGSVRHEGRPSNLVNEDRPGWSATRGRRLRSFSVSRRTRAWTADLGQGLPVNGRRARPPRGSLKPRPFQTSQTSPRWYPSPYTGFRWVRCEWRGDTPVLTDSPSLSRRRGADSGGTDGDVRLYLVSGAVRTLPTAWPRSLAASASTSGTGPHPGLKRGPDVTSNSSSREPRDARRQTPRVVRLPGFTADKEVGLGDAIKHATATLGIRPCGGCQRRAAALNRWMTISGRRPR